MGSSQNQNLSKAEMNARWEAYDAAVKSAVRGNWYMVHATLGNSALVKAADAASARPGARAKGVSCPVHGGTDGFSFYRDGAETGGGHCNTCGPQSDGYKVLMWSNGWDYKQTRDAVAGVMGINRKDFLDTAGYVPPARVMEPRGPSEAELRKQINRDRFVEDRMVAAMATAREVPWKDPSNPVRKYFEYRGLEQLVDDPPLDIYYIPLASYDALREINGRSRFVPLAFLPSAIAILRNIKGEAVGYHRIWMHPNGEKPFLDVPLKERPQSKLTCSLPSARTIRGAAVRLYEADHTLGVGEGIETMLGLRAFMAERRRGRKLAVWATLTAGGLEQLELPRHINSVMGFIDHDAPPAVAIQEFPPHYGRGQVAGMIFREQMKNRGGCRLFLPPKRGSDWLDIWIDYRHRLDATERHFADAAGIPVPEPRVYPFEAHKVAVSEAIAAGRIRTRDDLFVECENGPGEGVELFDPFDLKFTDPSHLREIAEAEQAEKERAITARREAEAEAAAIAAADARQEQRRLERIAKGLPPSPLTPGVTRETGSKAAGASAELAAEDEPADALRHSAEVVAATSLPVDLQGALHAPGRSPLDVTAEDFSDPTEHMSFSEEEDARFYGAMDGPDHFEGLDESDLAAQMGFEEPASIAPPKATRAPPPWASLLSGGAQLVSPGEIDEGGNIIQKPHIRLGTR